MTEPKREICPLFPEADRERLAALRKSDPEASLRERWALIQKLRPDIAEQWLGFVPQVISHGWAVAFIPEDGFAFTIGLRYFTGQPELLIAAPDLPATALGAMLNMLGRYVTAGHRIAAGELVDLEDIGTTLMFKHYSHTVFETYATGYLSSFECFFEDAVHESGDSLPVIWTKLKTVRAKAKAKVAAKRAAAKKKPAPKKKPVAKRQAAKKKR